MISNTGLPDFEDKDAFKYLKQSITGVTCSSVADIEQRIFELEEIRVVIRLPATYLLQVYDYKRQYRGDGKISDWIKSRIHTITGDPLPRKYVTVINGNGQCVISSMQMETVRDSYTK
jgi:hypothetical protein